MEKKGIFHLIWVIFLLESYEEFLLAFTLGYNFVCINLGRLAQMVERLPYTQNVGGSIPSAPTSFPYTS